jgi:hypothetical protein
MDLKDQVQDVFSYLQYRSVLHNVYRISCACTEELESVYLQSQTDSWQADS